MDRSSKLIILINRDLSSVRRSLVQCIPYVQSSLLVPLLIPSRTCNSFHPFFYISCLYCKHEILWICTFIVTTSRTLWPWRLKSSSQTRLKIMELKRCILSFIDTRSAKNFISISATKTKSVATYRSHRRKWIFSKLKIILLSKSESHFFVFPKY